MQDGIVTSNGFIVVSAQSATVVGFHTVLRRLSALKFKAISLRKMAKRQGYFRLPNLRDSPTPCLTSLQPLSPRLESWKNTYNEADQT